MDYGARMYDGQTGRWHTIDPKAAKYYSLSPYNFVANNPLKYIDPDGKDIKPAANSSYEFKKQLLTGLQKLTDDKLGYDRKGEKIVILQKADPGKSTKEFGTETIRSLVAGGKEGKNVVTVTDNTDYKSNKYVGNGYMTDSEEKSQGKIGDGEGSGGKVYWNTNSTRSDGKNRPAEVGLGHELIHADNANKAERLDPIDPIDGKTLSKEEKQTREKENVLRKEQDPKLPARQMTY